jgi:hypothetical protein
MQVVCIAGLGALEQHLGSARECALVIRLLGDWSAVLFGNFGPCPRKLRGTHNTKKWQAKDRFPALSGVLDLK